MEWLGMEDVGFSLLEWLGIKKKGFGLTRGERIYCQYWPHRHGLEWKKSVLA
jgi:hypothetical protein